MTGEIRQRVACDLRVLECLCPCAELEPGDECSGWALGCAGGEPGPEAGLRQGYAIAHADTIKKMRSWVGSGGTGSLNVFGMAAATVAIAQDDTFTTNERNRNKAVRDMAAKWFTDRGMKPTDCQANFMFVDIGTPAKAFREACRAKGVMVARDFPPFEKTHARISLGTMEEMTKAVQVFGEVLAKKSTAAA